MNQPLKILFSCTGNSCRSQMAEGLSNHLKSHQIEAHSAGIETHGLNPLAVRALAETGVDISHHTSRQVDQFLDEPWDVVETVWGHAHETCPLFPGHARIVYVGFDDPPALAKTRPPRKGPWFTTAGCATRPAHLLNPCLTRYRNNHTQEQIDQ
jgi:arsenate reductase (thioredoxin)